MPPPPRHRYQYFTRKCNFDANRRVDNYDNRVCHDWAATETMTKYVTGYGDSNDCGLGGHAGGGTLASYGWHYCNRLSSLQAEKSYFINPSSNTGCGEPSLPPLSLFQALCHTVDQHQLR